MKYSNYLQRYALVIIVILLSTISCKKDIPIPSDNSNGFDNSAITEATFLGQVIQEDGSPLTGAIVKTGNYSTVTDDDGFFYFHNISTSKLATLMKVEKSGFYSGFRTISVIEHRDNHVRIMMLSMQQEYSFDASIGGEIILASGGSISFEPSSVVNEANNMPYTGIVRVFATTIDPTSPNFPQSHPGSLRGVNTDNIEVATALKSQIFAVELRGEFGQKLQLASGTKAKVTIPIPSTLSAQAPENISLAYFNEETGMWQEEGTATKTGNAYVGSVNHFSFWSCFIFGNINRVHFRLQLTDHNNIPLVGATVMLSSTNYGLSFGITNSNGSVVGLIPANENFKLEYAPPGCTWNNARTFIQNLSSSTSNIDLGSIAVSSVNGTGVLKGTVEDCVANPLANAPVKIKIGTYVLVNLTNASGQFNSSIGCLTGATNAAITAYDVPKFVSGSSSATISPSVVTNAGVISACGTTEDYIVWTETTPLNQTKQYTLMTFNATFGQYMDNGDTYITGSGLHGMYFGFGGPQSSGEHQMVSYYDPITGANSFQSPANVFITRYDPVGGKIEGHFSVKAFVGPVVPNSHVDCQFRVTRLQ